MRSVISVALGPFTTSVLWFLAGINLQQQSTEFISVDVVLKVSGAVGAGIVAMVVALWFEIKRGHNKAVTLIEKAGETQKKDRDAAYGELRSLTIQCVTAIASNTAVHERVISELQRQTTTMDRQTTTLEHIDRRAEAEGVARTVEHKALLDEIKELERDRARS